MNQKLIQVFFTRFASNVGLIIAMTVAAISLALSLSPAASATSMYDANYQTTSEVYIAGGSCSKQDLTFTAFQYLTDSDTWSFPYDGSNPSSAMYMARQSFLNTLKDETNGSWGISFLPEYSVVMIFWAKNGASASLDWSNYNGGVGYKATDSNNVGNFLIGCRSTFMGGTSHVPIIFTGANYSDNLLIAKSDGSIQNLYAYNVNTNLPTGYAGLAIQDAAEDLDADGLSIAQETVIGTLDFTDDTDGDGLSDFTESSWNPDYNDIFCNTSITPAVCANPDPLKKDLFVEIDWTDDGTEEYKPTATQLNLVKQKYQDIGIRFHADIGQYGGGNELALPSYEATIDVRDDFYGYKWGYQTSDPANFDEKRYRIWHYMISGYNWTDGSIGSDESSGKAEAGGDDTFISLGLLEKEQSPGDFNNAVAGTIVHELGHNLCLAKIGMYLGQSSSCIFEDIDTTSASPNYKSVMNYDFQFTNLYSYSNGTNGSGDYNDLAGLLTGFDDFVWKDDDSDLGGPEG